MTHSLSRLVAETVRVEIARKRIPQTALAEALNLSQASVSRRLSGTAPFELDEIPVVAQVLGVSVASLLEDTAA